MQGEPDSAFALRMHNHASKEIDRLAQQNPFLLLAAALKETLDKVVIPRDPHDSARNQFVTNVEHFVDAHGRVDKDPQSRSDGTSGQRPALASDASRNIPG